MTGKVLANSALRTLFSLLNICLWLWPAVITKVLCLLDCSQKDLALVKWQNNLNGLYTSKTDTILTGNSGIDFEQDTPSEHCFLICKREHIIHFADYQWELVRWCIVCKVPGKEQAMGKLNPLLMNFPAYHQELGKMEKMGTTVPLLENPFHSFWPTLLCSLDIGVLKVSTELFRGKEMKTHVLLKKTILFTFWPPGLCNLSSPTSGLNPHPWQRKHGVLTTGPPGNSWKHVFKWQLLRVATIRGLENSLSSTLKNYK